MLVICIIVITNTINSHRAILRQPVLSPFQVSRKPIKNEMSPGRWLSCFAASSRKPKGCGFNPQWGHLQETTNPCSSLTSMLLSLSKMNKNISLGEEKNKNKMRLKPRTWPCSWSRSYQE